jgi:HEAT repeat protein
LTAAKKAWCAWALVIPVTFFAAGCHWGEVKIDTTKAYVDAKTVLRQAAEGNDPNAAETRRAAMSAIGEVMGEEGAGILKQALDDPDAGVRFAATMAIGDIKYEAALPVLQEKAKMYTGERDQRVYCATLYALYRLGDVTHLGDLADLLQDHDPKVRAVAAQVMGKIGNPAALVPLKIAVADEHDDGAKYNMNEALALLGDSGALIRLESYARGYFLDLQLEAIPALSREYSPDTMMVLRELTLPRFAPRVRVRASGAMARLGQVSAEGYKLCLTAARDPGQYADERFSEDQVASGLDVASLQQLAAISLGWMRHKEAIAVLGPLLQNPDGQVRVAAAMSILRILAAETPVRVAPAGAAPSSPAATQPGGALRPAPLRTSGAKD